MKHSRTNDFILLFDGWIAEEDTFLNYIRFDQCSKKIAAGDSSGILSWTSRHFFFCVVLKPTFQIWKVNWLF